jgi:hypothetical protein
MGYFFAKLAALILDVALPRNYLTYRSVSIFILDIIALGKILTTDNLRKREAKC